MWTGEVMEKGEPQNNSLATTVDEDLNPGGEGRTRRGTGNGITGFTVQAFRVQLPRYT